MKELQIGDRVKWSWYALQKDWDYYHNCGREPFKSNAKRHFEQKKDMRGTVLEVGKNTCKVKFDSQESIHDMLSYMVEKA